MAGLFRVLGYAPGMAAIPFEGTATSTAAPIGDPPTDSAVLVIENLSAVSDIWISNATVAVNRGERIRPLGQSTLAQGRDVDMDDDLHIVAASSANYTGNWYT